MFFDSIDLRDKLLQEKKLHEKTDLLQYALHILGEDTSTLQFTAVNKLQIDLLDTNRIFHKETIKKICIDYRLRFLDASYFTKDLPIDALDKIAIIEQQHQTQLHSFKILAPAKLLQLANYDDPILFAPIGNDYYYVIHKWGTDLSPFRKIKVWSLTSLGNLLISLVLLSIITNLCIPHQLFGNSSSNSIQFITFLFVFKYYCAIALYYFFWKGKNFSGEVWESKFYNG